MSRTVLRTSSPRSFSRRRSRGSRGDLDDSSGEDSDDNNSDDDEPLLKKRSIKQGATVKIEDQSDGGLDQEENEIGSDEE
jgi:hypothetical protein